MVYFNKQAILDLEGIFEGLILWKKHPLEIEHAKKYRDDIIDICQSLENTNYHLNIKFPEHKIYGSKFTRYRRNKNTIWYIIYNIAPTGDIFIEKVTNNYDTTILE